MSDKDRTPDPEAPTEPVPETPSTLGDGRYELGAVLGSGGMGIVRRATDTMLHREVAVKLLADNLAVDREARQRFLHEGRAIARVSNPHVVAVHDVGEDGGRPYLVLELVDGPSLAEELRRDGPLDGDEVAAVAAQALAGLTAAHAAGVLHRDVKPGNLLRTPTDDVKVVDFGVAQAADTPGLTRTGFVIGTRSYLAPERRRGAPATVATDLYALGATLVELLTGSPPSTQPDADPLAALPADVPAGLRYLLERLLDPAPGSRPASAEEALITLVEGRHGTEAAATALRDDETLPGTAPAHHDADTEPVGAPPRRRTTGRSTADRSTAAAATTAKAASRSERTQQFVEHGWRAVLLIGLALIAVGILLRLTGGGTGESPPPDEAGAEDDSASELTDEARELARWLRERADG